MANHIEWTPDKLNYVKEKYSGFTGNLFEFTDMFNAEFGTNATWVAIRQVANHVLKISKDKKTNKKWTPEMDAYLIETYPTFDGTSDELAKIISDNFNVNITKMSVYNRIRKLNIKKVEGWGKIPDEQISYVQQCQKDNILVEDITRAFNLKFGTNYEYDTMKNIVYTYCNVLNILTEEQINYIKETYPAYQGTQKEYFKELKGSFKVKLSFISFSRIIRALKLTKKSVHKKSWTSEMDTYLVKAVPTFEGTFDELAELFNKEFKVKKTSLAVRARVEALNIKKPPSPFTKYTTEVVNFVKETFSSYKGTLPEYEELLRKTFKRDINLKSLCIKDELKNVKKPSAILVWTPEKDAFILNNYKKYTRKTRDLLEIFNNRFNTSTSLKAFQAHASILFSNRKYLVKELSPDINKIDPVLIPHMRTTNDRGQTRHKISLAKYNWLMAGNKIENPEEGYFIYWDDDTTNCDVSNLQLVSKGVCSAYGNAKREMPRGDIELNKDIYKRVLLEQLSKDIS